MTEPNSEEREESRYRAMRRNRRQYLHRQVREADARVSDIYDNDPMDEDGLEAARAAADAARWDLAEDRADEFRFTERTFIKP